jgi:hypothetical protein
MAGCRFILQPGMTTRMKARRAFLFVELGMDAIFYTADTWVDPSGFSTYHQWEVPNPVFDTMPGCPPVTWA